MFVNFQFINIVLDDEKSIFQYFSRYLMEENDELITSVSDHYIIQTHL